MAARFPVDGEHQEETELKLPSGFRFRPSDDQIVGIYLRNEASGGPCVIPGFKIPLLDVYGTEPWLLLPLANTRFSVAGEFYCFARMKQPAAEDGRRRWKTPNGEWKPVGNSQRPVFEHREGVRGPCIGFTSQFKFIPDGVDDEKSEATVWIMDEYRLPFTFWVAFPSDVRVLAMCKITPKPSQLVAIDEESTKKRPLPPCLPDGAAEDQPRTKNARTDELVSARTRKPTTSPEQVYLTSEDSATGRPTTT